MKNSINKPILLTFNRLRPPRDVLQYIRDTLRAGGVVMYPTDTCYALSCAVNSQEGVHKIFAIKQRHLGKHVSVAFSDISMLEQFTELTDDVRAFIKTNGPQRVTLLVKKKEDVWKDLPLLKDTHILGARIPKDTFTRKLIQAVGTPLVTTSANVSGQPEIYTRHAVYNFLSNIHITPDIIIMGHLVKNPPSTIFDTLSSPWKVIRQGKFLR